MPTEIVIVLVVLGVVALGAIAWWSSGRTKSRTPGPNPDGDAKQASAYQYQQNRGPDNLPGGGGGSF